MADLQSVKIGDRVWLGSERNPTQRIETVTKVTATQIVVGKHRYRLSGFPIGNRYADQITGVPTPAECVAYDKNVQRMRAERDAKTKSQGERDATRHRLFDLFPNHTVNISETITADDRGKWDIEFLGLTSEQIESLAKAVADSFSVAPEASVSNGAAESF